MKLFTHVLIYFFEISIVTTSLVYLFADLDYARSNVLSIIKEYVFSYTVYQLLLISVFKLYDSLHIDALSAMRKQIDRIQLYAEYNKKVPEDLLIKIKSEYIDNRKTVLNTGQRNFLLNVMELTKRYNTDVITKDEFRFIMKQESLALDHSQKVYNFHWMNSILLRMFK